MSDAFWGAFFGAIPATIVAYAALRSTFRIGEQVRDVRRQTDGITTSLVKAEQQRALLQGRAEGEAAERARSTPSNGSQGPVS